LILNIDLSGVNDQGLGAFVLNTEGGTPPMTYTVNGVPCTPPCLSEPGAFDVVATDFNGCTASENLVITHVGTADEGVLKVWPNPANTHITFEALTEGAIIVAYNPQGQRVFEDTVLSSNTRVSILDWAPGIYTLIVQSASSLYAMRLVVNR